MTISKSNYTCLEQTSMTVSDEQEQLLNVKRLTLAGKVLQAGHVHAPSVEALILKQIEASQRNNPNHTCHKLPTSLEQVALTVVSQPQKYIVGDGEELKHLVLARKVMETRHLHLPTFNALSLKRIEALEQNITIKKQDPRPSRTSILMDQPSAEPSIAALADTSFLDKAIPLRLDLRLHH